ncbi:hypothetical protein CLAFUW4_09398 [Fulvia fulva]|uniref:Uncharacterized protein n=1 Tax=Passalora fulva TaxID=5499 RepID=A0A9Q8PFD2_PASFU|nr:uncharacterized protein CLAFUR5_09497 [Fulvia fulva]KAK4614121.1 hypothetical protein CLAFUR4_09404 [Fulvia fulva]UJO21468.1 hypothetical protein CLAFUR5_09497 [Fulvia fulva]WPV20538.1 hypothetical protein CLAFUW4_09398 [Fulvia fulva]WPV35095.1 hypothetical protein CLAFUW7_09399 [Fulvia fulva]
MLNQIYYEARDILYDENACQIEISSRWIPEHGVRCISHAFLSDIFVNRDDSLGDTREVWPAHMLQFTTVTLSLRVEGVGINYYHDADVLAPLHHMLLSLCSRLKSSTHVNKLQIKSLLGNTPLYPLRRVLRPLARLVPSVKLEFIDFPSSLDLMFQPPIAAKPELIQSLIEKLEDDRLKRSPKKMQKYVDLVANHSPIDILADLRADSKKASRIQEVILSLDNYRRHLAPRDEKEIVSHAMDRRV